MVKWTLPLVGIGIFASSASAAPFFARGDFNSWGTGHEMTETSSGSKHYTVTATGLTAGSKTQFKIAESDWDPSFPNGNARTQADASGAITFHFYEGAVSDGWMGPTANRVGISDFGSGWEVMGSFNGWSSPALTLSDGNNDGIFTGGLVVPTAGAYQFKFRKTGDWDVAYGDDGFNTGSGNLGFTTTNSNEQLSFSFDPAGGRYLVSVVPEPAALSLIGLGGLALLRRRQQA